MPSLSWSSVGSTRMSFSYFPLVFHGWVPYGEMVSAAVCVPSLTPPTASSEDLC